MNSVLQNDVIDKLPGDKLTTSPEVFLGPVLIHLPEKRLRDTGTLVIQGILVANYL